MRGTQKMRTRSLLVAFFLMAGALTGVAVGTGAASAYATTESCPPPPQTPPDYPPASCSLNINPASQKQGQNVHVSGCGFQSGATVTIRLDGSTVLGTATAKRNGCFGFNFKIPLTTSVGQHTLSA